MNRTILKNLKQQARKSHGFTIVELIAVIVVIAILATVVIVSYNGVSGRAVETSMRSDLQSAASVVEKDKSRAGSYPSSAAQANNGAGLEASENNTLAYVKTSVGYCISVTSTKAPTKQFHITSDTGKIEDGGCVSNTATVTTLAGNSSSGYVNGTGSTVRFDFFNNIDTDAGWGIDIDDDTGDVYIADYGNNVIRKMTATGTVSKLIGETGDGGEVTSPGSGTVSTGTISFNYPFDVWWDRGTNLKGLMVPTGSCIRTVVFDENGSYWSDAVNGGAFEYHDNHYECPYATNTGSRDTWGSLYKTPNSVVLDSHNDAYINDAMSNQVRKMHYDGDDWWDTVDTLSGAGAFSYFARFGVDPQDRIYGTTVDGRIARFTTTGNRTIFAGSTSKGFADGTGANAKFQNPGGVDVDGNGNVYVADCGNHRIRKITPSGVVTTIAGSSSTGNVDGVGGAAKFYCPTDITVNAAGTLMYVIDVYGIDDLGTWEGGDVGGYIRKLTL